MRRLSLAAAIVAALSLTALPSAARDIPEGGLTLQQIVDWLKAAGYKAEIETNGGEQSIASNAQGNNFHISQYDCKDGVCGSLQFWVGFNTGGASSSDKVNDWNTHNRWLRSYVDKENDPWIEMDVDLTPGGTYENLDDEFAIWRDGLERFMTANLK